jgi:hypothetical protein
MGGTPARRVTAAAIVVICAVFAFRAPADPVRYDNDRIVSRMRSGEGYYDAAERTFEEVGGTIETARGYRPPTAYLLWRWLPHAALWPAYAMLVAASAGLVLLLLARNPWGPLLATVYLLALGSHAVEYLFTELWVVPLVAAAFVARRRGREALGAAMALTATAVRELAVTAIVGGVLAARRRVPWLAALATAAVLYAIHARLVAPHLGDSGTEARLLGTGSVRAVVDMMGFQLPVHSLTGPVVWLLAVVGTWRARQLRLLGPHLLLPFIGLVVDRPYWGALVVPFTIVAAVDAVADVVTRRPRAAPDEGR